LTNMYFFYGDIINKTVQIAVVELNIETIVNFPNWGRGVRGACCSTETLLTMPPYSKYYVFFQGRNVPKLFFFGCGSAPDPSGGAYNTPRDPFISWRGECHPPPPLTSHEGVPSAWWAQVKMVLAIFTSDLIREFILIRPQLLHVPLVCARCLEIVITVRAS